MASVWGELKRRNVVKVAVAYAIVGWLLIEIASTVLPTFEAPQWVLQTITFVIILGFPLALVLAWIFDLTPHGVERTDSDPQNRNSANVTGRKLDFAIIGALVAALGFVIYNYVLEDDQSVAPEVALVEPEPDVLPNSVAVLPLDNLSPDPDNAYFALGLHEEILNQLAKLRSLSVISRTSVLQYAENKPDIREIAEDLNVQSIMEGSVRYAGDRIRVTTQLIDPVTGAHLWSETYDRDFDDVFAIESDIAMNIANALEAEFSLSEQESIEQIPTSSPAAYSLYLRALSTGPFDLESTINDLDQATALDPQFALAYGYKAYQLVQRGRGRADVFADWEVIGQEAAERALELDPNLAWAHAARGGIHYANGRRREAQEALELAYELNPDDLDVQAAYATLKWDTGQYEETLTFGQRMVELNPTGEHFGHHVVGLAHLHMHDYEAAAASFRRNLELNPGSPISQLQLTRTVAASGDHAAAAREIQLAEQLSRENMDADRLVVLAALYSRVGRPEDAARLLDELDRTGGEAQVATPAWASLHLANGQYNQARPRLEEAITGRDSNPGVLNGIKANIYQDPVLEEPVWRALRDRIHALD